MLRTFLHCWRFYKAKPVLLMSRYGQCTPRPRVTLSLVSAARSPAAHGLFCENDDDAGNARIEIYGGALSRMTGIPLSDEREPRIYFLEGNAPFKGWWWADDKNKCDDGPFDTGDEAYTGMKARDAT